MALGWLKDCVSKANDWEGKNNVPSAQRENKKRTWCKDFTDMKQPLVSFMSQYCSSYIYSISNVFWYYLSHSMREWNHIFILFLRVIKRIQVLTHSLGPPLFCFIFQSQYTLHYFNSNWNNALWQRLCTFVSRVTLKKKKKNRIRSLNVSDESCSLNVEHFSLIFLSPTLPQSPLMDSVCVWVCVCKRV